MRIVHVITRLIVGGAQENTLLSCEGQHDLGHDVTLITGPPLGPEGSLLERAQGYGYRVEVIDEMRRAVLPLKDYRTYKALRRRFVELRPDIVHTHSSKAGIIGRWAAHRARKCKISDLKSQIGGPAVLHTIHGLAFTASTRRAVNGFYKHLERRIAPVTDTIICVADAMREQSLAAGIGTSDQYTTVYSGMDIEPFLKPPVPRLTVRTQLGLKPEHIAVGMIARLFHLKGHDDLLDSAPRLCTQHPDLRFLWVGDGLLRPQFEQRIAAMGLSDRFILPGLVPPSRIPELANAMDILVHPSRREGLARALPQAQLAGCPVIAYDVDGNREGFLPDRTGFLITPFDRAKLSERLGVLLSSQGLRRSMGEAGRAFAAGRFAAPVMIEALERVYKKALDRPR